jgi:alpha-tubulin suppressor-like RCC1 family protein
LAALTLSAALLFSASSAQGAAVAAGQPVSWGYLNTPRLGTVFTNIAAGGLHSLAVQSDGTILVWGGNYGTYAGGLYVETGATIPSDLSNVVAVAAGINWSPAHGIALKNDGTVAPWGDNSYGQTNAPAGLSNVIIVAAGEYHCAVLKSDRTVVCWGSYTKLTGGFFPMNSPTDLTNAIAIAAGRNFNLAVKADGTVSGWGDYAGGASEIPDGLSNVVAVAAGWGHSLALKSDGTVAGWGDDTYGEATPPDGLSNVVAIAAGGGNDLSSLNGDKFGHSLALKSDGTVVAWGKNNAGQANVPPGLSNVVAIAAGARHSLALLRDGAAVTTVTALRVSHQN